MPRLTVLSPILLACLILQGCATPILVAGAAAGVTLANDRRAPGTIIDDQDIEIHLRSAINDDAALADDTHISVTSFNHVLLLTGEVRDTQQRDKVMEHARNTQNIKRIHDEIQIAAPISSQDYNQDTWITTKVKGTLAQQADLNALNVKVVTENSIVYLMGLVTRAEGNIAATATQQVAGVRGVIKVFEYLD